MIQIVVSNGSGKPFSIQLPVFNPTSTVDLSALRRQWLRRQFRMSPEQIAVVAELLFPAPVRERA
jgi:hypothetical protein